MAKKRKGPPRPGRKRRPSEMPSHPCRQAQLPDEETRIAAARTAIEINPANEPRISPELLHYPAEDYGPGPVLSPGRLAVLTSKYWGPNGAKLSVYFMDNPAAELKRKILAYANKWATRCNISFHEGGTDSDVRLSRGAGGYWSYLGPDIRHIQANSPTMNLQGFSLQTPDAEFDRVVCHEFGHTMGFPHEHMRSQIVARIDPAKAINYFKRTQGWSARDVQQQVLTAVPESAIRATPEADEKSIMAYWLPAEIMRDGKAVPGGLVIDEQDFALAEKLYPKESTPQPPTGGPGTVPVLLEIVGKDIQSVRVVRVGV